MAKTIKTDNYNGKDRRNGNPNWLQNIYVSISIIVIILGFAAWLQKTNYLANYACKQSEAAIVKTDTNRAFIVANREDIISMKKDIEFQTRILVRVDRTLDKIENGGE